MDHERERRGNGRVWAGLLGIERSTVERVEFDVEEGLLVAHVRPALGERGRCGVPAAVSGL
jgi:hypothetical protein